MIVGYILFFLAGVGFGYAAPGKLVWVPLLFPIVLALIAVASTGIDVIALIVALLVTVVGILVGMMLRNRGEAAAQRS